jgi:hypothetical protein
MPMIHRPLLLVLALSVASSCAAAAEGDLERATRLRNDAKALREQADDTLRATEPGCYARFLVNRCLTQAKEARLGSMRKARDLESEAIRLELAEKQRLAAERAAAERDVPARTAPPQPALPSAIDKLEVGPDKAAEEIRRARGAQAGHDAAAAQARQRVRDADRAGERAKAEAEAAKRVEQAQRDRERYDKRIRKRAAEKAEE